MPYPDYHLRLGVEQAAALRAAAAAWVAPAAQAAPPGPLTQVVRTLRDLLTPVVGGPPGLESLLVLPPHDRRIEDGSVPGGEDPAGPAAVQRDQPGWHVVARAPGLGRRSRRGTAT